MNKISILKRVLAVSVISVVVTSLSADEKVGDESITFTFAPKDGMLYLQNLTSTREKVLENGQKQIEKTIATVKVRINKTKYGWEINTVPIELQMERDGEDIINPLARLVTYGEKTYKLDNNGKIQDITGYESMLRKIKDQFSEKEIQGFQSILDIDTLKQKDMQEWNGRIGNFLGTTVLIGEKTTGKVPSELPNGQQINYTVNTHYRGLETCAQSKCVRIKQSYDSSAHTDNLLSSSSQKVSLNSSQVANRVSAHKVAGVKENITRLIDPNTMLIYEEIVERDTNHKTMERHVYKYDY